MCDHNVPEDRVQELMEALVEQAEKIEAQRTQLIVDGVCTKERAADLIETQNFMQGTLGGLSFLLPACPSMIVLGMVVYQKTAPTIALASELALKAIASQG